MNKKHLRALGPEATLQDLQETEILLGKTFIEPSEDPNKQLLASGSNLVGVTFSETQFSAHIAAMHPIREVSTKFRLDEFEISGVLERERIRGFKETLGIKSFAKIPLFWIAEKFLLVDTSFYFKGWGAASENDIHIKVEEAKIGIIPLPPSWAGNLLEEYFELVLEKAPAFNAEEVTLQDDFMFFYGTATATVPKY